MQGIEEFTVAWLRRLQELWDAASTAEEPLTEDAFRAACQAGVPPRSNTVMKVAQELKDLYQGREILMHCGLYVNAALDDWTETSLEETVADTGVMKHVKLIKGAAKVHHIMEATMQEWAVCNSAEYA